MGNLAEICCKKPDALEAPKEALRQDTSEPTDPSSRKAKEILSKYVKIKDIASGSFGKVMLMERDKKKYAMKRIPKALFKESLTIESIITEKKVMRDVDNPFIVKLFETFQDTQYMYFIMEFCNGGELFDYINKYRKFSENNTRFYAAEIILGLEALHSKGIMHRDIKPENILLDSEGHVKLTDFGLSKIGVDKSATKCGTPLYVSPENALGQTYDRTVDFWALGCLIYEMIHGTHPFEDKNTPLTVARIKSGKHHPFNDSVTEDARDLISKMLKVDPKQRLGANGIEEIKNHPFFGKIDWNDVSLKKIAPPYKIDDITNKPVTKTHAQVEPVDEKSNVVVPNFTYVGSSNQPGTQGYKAP